ncbi:hypothetical protein RJG79_02790 [Mycoplasmatota bacterium WC44]
MNLEEMLMFYNFGIFLIMIPILFKAFMAFDLDRFFKRGYVWQKQVVYLVLVIITANAFANTFTDLVKLLLNMSG